MKRIKPDIGHLVMPIADGTLVHSLGRIQGLIIDKRGIEVVVMWQNNEIVWRRRDLLEVISECW